MMYYKISALGLLFIFLFSRCADKIISECDKDNDSKGINATFQSIQKTVLANQCALSGCHQGSTPAESLNLEAQLAYGNLINVKSVQDPSLMRVSPTKSHKSYLIKKLSQPDLSIMPPAGKLEQAFIDTITVWIDRGALNN